MKKSVVKIIALLLVGSVAFPSSAHTTKQAGTIVWGESVGWSIDESYHTNGKNIQYRFNTSDPYMSTSYSYRTYATNGGNLWNNNTSYVYIEQNSSYSVGEVQTYSDSGSSTVARLKSPYYSDSNGHFTHYIIEMNRPKFDSLTTAQKNKVMAHEFGHAIGLNDLYLDNNKGKLMYGRVQDMGSTPTTSDIRGARVINGSHSSHSWGNYKYYDTSSGGKRHKGSCTTCDGVQAVASYCTYSSGGTKCTVCNTAK